MESAHRTFHQAGEGWSVVQPFSRLKKSPSLGVQEGSLGIFGPFAPSWRRLVAETEAIVTRTAMASKNFILACCLYVLLVLC